MVSPLDSPKAERLELSGVIFTHPDTELSSSPSERSFVRRWGTTWIRNKWSTRNLWPLLHRTSVPERGGRIRTILRTPWRTPCRTAPAAARRRCTWYVVRRYRIHRRQRRTIRAPRWWNTWSTRRAAPVESHAYRNHRQSAIAVVAGPILRSTAPPDGRLPRIILSHQIGSYVAGSTHTLPDKRHHRQAPTSFSAGRSRLLDDYRRRRLRLYATS